MNTFIINKIVVLIIFLLMASLSYTYYTTAAVTESTIAEQQVKKHAPSPSAKSCLTSECHQELKKEKYVHPNIKENKCVICHEPAKGSTHYQSGKKHTFTLKGNDAELCFPCHKIGQKEYVHETIKKGICLECHNAHQSRYPKLLKSVPIATICLKCHVKGIFRGKTIHGPVALGHCNICHEPHESYYESLTRGEATEECFKCHEKEKKEFDKEYVHKPVREDCNDCHDPHASPEVNRLRLPSPDSCYDCHKDQEKFIESVNVKHDAITEDKQCLNCHTPHASNLPKQLKSAPMDLCLVCHNKEMDTPYGTIMNMVGFLDNNSYVHGPIKKGDCSACHNPHGSDYWRLVRQYFPQEFYAPFSLGMYELCFGCHEKTTALTEETSTLTGFRNGEHNLHFSHVNKDDKGRTCKACHDIHASNNPMHIAYDFPYGQWVLPINYEPMENGGRCTPGCHETKAFDRNNPVDNKSTLLEKYGGEEEEKSKGRKRKQ
jgi:predicted CXXCH cytochrome family protein